MEKSNKSHGAKLVGHIGYLGVSPVIVVPADKPETAALVLIALLSDVPQEKINKLLSYLVFIKDGEPFKITPPPPLPELQSVSLKSFDDRGVIPDKYKQSHKKRK